MNILILGSEGFIGKHCVDFFVKHNHNVFGADLVDYKTGNYTYTKISRLAPDFEQLFQHGIKFNTCINAAGNGSVPASILNPFADYESNCTDVIKILDCIRKYNPDCKYIQLSSASVYGNPQKLPILESDATLPLSPYGYHKLVSELLCKEYFNLYNLPVVILRPFSVFGNGLKKQLLWDICTKFTDSDSITLYGTGYESRDFIHIDDLIRVIDTVIEKSPFQCEVYNIAAGKETTIKEIASIFETFYCGRKKIQFSGETKKGDPINWKADISKLNALGFLPEANIEPRMVNYINWHAGFLKANT